MVLPSLLPSSAWAQPGPSITRQPAGQTVLLGSKVTLTVAAAGAGSLSYQWRQDGVNLASNLIATMAGGWLGDGGEATNAGLAGPGLAVAQDASGNLFVADSGNNRVRKVDVNGVITTVAGNGVAGYSGDGGAATNASLGRPKGVAVDPSGNLYIADNDNNCIRKVNTNGIITTVAGSLSADYSGDGGLATNASLNAPSGVAVDASGNIFIADTSNQRVRKVDPNGIITTIAGNPASSAFPPPFGGWQSGYSGDGGAATAADLSGPTGVAVGASGKLFIADSGNNRVRQVTASGIITTVAGNGTGGYSGDGGIATNAGLSPLGVSVDATGELFIADSGSQRVRKVDTKGIVTTVAGGRLGDGAAATLSTLQQPSGAALDATGNLFIADTSNQRVRKVDPNGIITTVAGNGSLGYSGDGGLATRASLNGPSGVAVDASGNLYIADSFNNCVRKLSANGIITTVAGTGSNGYSGDGGLAIKASLDNPSGVAVDASGNLYIADTDNSCVRRVTANGIIKTVAGNGTGGYSGDGGAATNASLNGPFGVAVDASGNLYIADTGNNRIREIAFRDLPSLTLESVSKSNAGDYQVSITSPSGSVTSAVATVTIVLPPVSAALSAAPGLQITFGGVPGSSYILQTAVNLNPPVNWQSVVTNAAAPLGNWTFSDTNTAGFPARFYRLKLP